MVTQKLGQVLESVTSDALDSDYFLEESRERERDYSKSCYLRWKDTLEIALSYLGGGEARTALDVGVSQFTLCLPEFFAKVYALDLTEAFEQRCARHGIKLYHGGVHVDGTVEPIPKVDCVFFLDAIEHIHDNPVDILTRLHSRLTDNGILVVSTCNMMCLGNRIRMLRNKKLVHFTYPPFQKPLYNAHGFAHDRIYCPEELGEYMSAAGCSKVDCIYPMAGDIRLAKLTSPTEMMSYLLKKAFPSLRATMLFVGRK